MQPQPSNVLDLHSFSVSALRALNMGVAIMRRFGHRALNTEHALLALLNQTDGNANKILQHFGVDLFALRRALEQYLAEATTVPLSDLAFEADGGQRVPLSPNLALILDRARIIADNYRLAWVGVVERPAPLRELVNILLQRRPSSAVVVGEVGVGKRSLVAGLAQLVARGQAPAALAG